MVEFAHVFETALDAMRSGKLDPDGDVLKLMLRASDVLADHVQAAKGQGAVDEARTHAMAGELAALTSSEPLPTLAPVGSAGEPAADEWGFTPLKFEVESPSAAPGSWRLVMRPTAAMYAKGHDALLFLRELSRLSDLSVSLDQSALPD
ncbi:MAG: hypothetical protein IPL62_21200 [Caulobacteraceae bacterium]|nr:hypothetical protein [Caulobacteraceae bacterium]